MSDETKKKTPEPPFEIQLAYPVKLLERTRSSESERVIERVTVLRRPRVKDIKALSGKTEVDQMMIAIERVTDLPVVAIPELDVVDFATLSEAISPFFLEAGAVSEASSVTSDARS